MEKDQQVSSIGIPSNATSQAWIDVEHGEITLLVGEKKLKFNCNTGILIYVLLYSCKDFWGANATYAL